MGCPKELSLALPSWADMQASGFPPADWKGDWVGRVIVICRHAKGLRLYRGSVLGKDLLFPCA